MECVIIGDVIIVMSGLSGVITIDMYKCMVKYIQFIKLYLVNTCYCRPLCLCVFN